MNYLKPRDESLPTIRCYHVVLDDEVHRKLAPRYEIRTHFNSNVDFELGGNTHPQARDFSVRETPGKEDWYFTVARRPGQEDSELPVPADLFTAKGGRGTLYSKCLTQKIAPQEVDIADIPPQPHPHPHPPKGLESKL